MRSEAGTGTATPSPAVHCALFDLDGTVVDSLALIRASLRHATLTVLGASPPDDDLMHNVGLPLAAQMRTFDPGRVDELVAAYREHNDRWHDALVKEYPGVREGLEELAGSGLRVGLVTSKVRDGALRALDRLGLRHLFEVVIGSDDVPSHKPDPAPLLAAARQLGIEARRCAYVGDSHHDMAAARGAGMLPVGVLWGVSDADRLRKAGAQRLARDMSDVVNALLGRA